MGVKHISDINPPKLNTIAPKKGATKRRRRIGRGISAGQGASGGFGMRGQKSRSGKGTKPGFEGGQMPLYRRVPKLKHFQPVNPKRFTVINVCRLNNLPPHSLVTLETLVQHGIVTTDDSPLKILGDGELRIPLAVKASAFSAAAKEKISLSGGTWEILPTTTEPEPVDAEIGFLSARPTTREEVQTAMGVISYTEHGYHKFTFHTKWLDLPVEHTVDISSIEINKNSDDESIADQYLKNIMSLPILRNFVIGKDQKVRYDFEKYETKRIKFTDTFTAKYHQYYKGFPFYGSFVSVQLDEKKELLSVSSAIGVGNISELPDSSEEVSETEVKAIVSKSAGYTSPEALYNLNIRKCWYYQDKSETWHFSYLVEDVLKSSCEPQEKNLLDERPEVVDYVIKSLTGEIIDEIPRIQ